jgi:2-aminoadipate transaminase
LPASLRAAARVSNPARFVYLLPNFQNPSGRCVGAKRRLELVDAALTAGLPIVEDNPYGELWFDAPPPPPLSASAGDQALYLGSFSKVLAPGLRLGYMVAPKAMYPKLLQAKQAADLHTPGFNQRVVYEVIKDGFLTQHVPTIRARYKAQRDAMQAALEKYLRPLFDGGIHWQTPLGGIFFWLSLPAHINTTALLPKAVAAGMAYVPGSTFFPHGGHANTLRLSFVTASPTHIETAVSALAQVLSNV